MGVAGVGIAIRIVIAQTDSIEEKVDDAQFRPPGFLIAGAATTGIVL